MNEVHVSIAGLLLAGVIGAMIGVASYVLNEMAQATPESKQGPSIALPLPPSPQVFKS